jgi:hypothetical protein
VGLLGIPDAPVSESSDDVLHTVAENHSASMTENPIPVADPAIDSKSLSGSAGK